MYDNWIIISSQTSVSEGGGLGKISASLALNGEPGSNPVSLFSEAASPLRSGSGEGRFSSRGGVGGGGGSSSSFLGVAGSNPVSGDGDLGSNPSSCCACKSLSLSSDKRLLCLLNIRFDWISAKSGFSGGENLEKSKFFMKN